MAKVIIESKGVILTSQKIKSSNQVNLFVPLVPKTDRRSTGNKKNQCCGLSSILTMIDTKYTVILFLVFCSKDNTF